MEQGTTYGEKLIGLRPDPTEPGKESAMDFNMRTSKQAVVDIIDSLYGLCSESECTALVREYAEKAILRLAEGQRLAENAFVGMELVWSQNGGR